VLIENVTHHIEEEERDWFPKVRAGLGRKQLQELGAKLELAREKAPRSPAQPSALKKTVDAIIPAVFIMPSSHKVAPGSAVTYSVVTDNFGAERAHAAS
jgi:hypothetical protein